jgi:hypothetical protein
LWTTSGRRGEDEHMEANQAPGSYPKIVNHSTWECSVIPCPRSLFNGFSPMTLRTPRTTGEKIPNLDIFPIAIVERRPVGRLAIAGLEGNGAKAHTGCEAIIASKATSPHRMVYKSFTVALVLS